MILSAETRAQQPEPEPPEGFKMTGLGPLPEGWRVQRMGDVLTQRTQAVRVTAGGRYTRLGVRWYAEGPFNKQPVSGGEIRGQVLYRVEPRNFVCNRLFSWKGSFGVVSHEMIDCHVSGEFPVFECDPSRVDPFSLWRLCSQPSVWRMTENRSSGTTKD